MYMQHLTGQTNSQIYYTFIMGRSLNFDWKKCPDTCDKPLHTHTHMHAHAHTHTHTHTRAHTHTHTIHIHTQYTQTSYLLRLGKFRAVMSTG